MAVVGLGVGEQHARAYLATGQCELRWLCDLDNAKARSLTSTLGTGRVAESLTHILEDSRVQVVSIASYDDAHFDQTVAALNAGKHVFVEKPLCRTLEELRVIKQTWEKQSARLHLASNLVLRAAPLYCWLREQIQSGRLGKLYSVEGDYLYGRLHKITHGWRKDVPDYSVMEGGGIHLVDLMLWLAGERPDTVYAMGNKLCTNDTAFAYDDFATALLRFPSGLLGGVRANFGCVHRHQHVVRLFGTEGTFFHDDAGPRLHRSRDPEVAAETVSLDPLPRSKRELIAPFVSAILTGTPTTRETQQFFDGISVCVACDQSQQCQSPVRVTYV